MALVYMRVYYIFIIAPKSSAALGTNEKKQLKKQNKRNEERESYY
jgi:hypothetical protein